MRPMRIVKQWLWPEGIMTEYEDGSLRLLPYKIDENGEKYADLDPNGEIFV